MRNRPHGGTAAFEVLVPFRLADGRVLLIDRGWVPPGEDQPLPDVIPAPPEGETTVIARLRPAEQLPASGRSAPEGQVPTINPELVADVIDPGVGGDLELSAYGVMVSEDPAPRRGPPRWRCRPKIRGRTCPTRSSGSCSRSWGSSSSATSSARSGDTGARTRRSRAATTPRHGARPARRRDRDMQDEDSILDAAGR